MFAKESISLNGIRIGEGKKGAIMMSQRDKIHKLGVPTTQSAFSIIREATKYVGVNTRLDMCTTIQLIAPGRKDTSHEEFNKVKKTINFLRTTELKGLTIKN